MLTQKIERRRQFFKSFEAKSLRNRPPLVKFADDLTSWTGTPTFLLLNTYLFVVWIGLNVKLIPGITPFDPFPFGLLTMMVSLEAIFLSIFVLISQNRSAYISTIRDEVHLQINMQSEREVTKILQILADMRQKMGITKEDPELHQMLEHTDAGYIEQRIVEQLQRANKSVIEQLTKEFPDILHFKRQTNGESKNLQNGEHQKISVY